MAHAPASIGPVLPTKGGATENQTTPLEQRAPEGAPLSDGPKRGAKGEYLPATYKRTTQVQSLMPGSLPMKVELTITDR